MSSPEPEAIRAVPLRHWGRWVSALVVALLAAWLVQAAVNSHFIDFHVVRRFLTKPIILKGLRNTLILSVASQGTGIVLGVIFAVMRLAKNPVLSRSRRVVHNSEFQLGNSSVIIALRHERLRQATMT